MKLNKSIKVRGTVIPAGTNLTFNSKGYATYAGMQIAKVAVESVLNKAGVSAGTNTQKLAKAIRLNGKTIPAGTKLAFSNEGIATYKGQSISIYQIPTVAFESYNTAMAALEAGTNTQKLAKAIRLNGKTIPAGTKLAFSNEGVATYNGQSISIYQIPTAAFESYNTAMAALEANNEIDKTIGLKEFDSIEPGDLGSDVDGQPVRFLGKAMGKAGYDALVNQFGNTSQMDFDALTVNMDNDEIDATGFVAYSTGDGSVCVGIYGPDDVMAMESDDTTPIDFYEVESGDDAIDWEGKPCMIVAKGTGSVWYKKMLEATKCTDRIEEIKEALNADDDELSDVDFVLVINDKQEKNLSHYGDGGVNVYKTAE